MNSGQDADPGSPEGDAADTDTNSGPLQESQDAIDRGREAAREALKDNPPVTAENGGGQVAQEPED
jgi:hypothetical protein